MRIDRSQTLFESLRSLRCASRGTWPVLFHRWWIAVWRHLLREVLSTRLRMSTGDGAVLAYVKGAFAALRPLTPPLTRPARGRRVVVARRSGGVDATPWIGAWFTW